MQIMIFAFLWSEQQLLVKHSWWFSQVDSLQPYYYADFENGSVDSQLLTYWGFFALKSENIVVSKVLLRRIDSIVVFLLLSSNQWSSKK